MAGARVLLAGCALALVFAASAIADSPTIKITKEDQARAESTLLRLHDFGAGWTGGPKPPSKLEAPGCPGFDPKESDLTVTGHAEAHFALAHYGVAIGQDTQVLESTQAVATDFARSITPKLPDCLAYRLKASGKGQVVAVHMRKLGIASIGDQFGAYRAEITVSIKGRRWKYLRDFIFVGVGRFEFSIFVDGPQQDAAQLVAFEQAMVQKLVKRAGSSGNVA